MVMTLASKINNDAVIQSGCHLLKSDLYEARVAVLQMLKIVISPKQSEIMRSSIESLVFPILEFPTHEKSLKEEILSSDKVAEQLLDLMCNPSEQTTCVVEVITLLYVLF